MPKKTAPFIADTLLKAFTAASSDIIHLNDVQGNIIYSNQASEDLLGFGQDELLDTPATSLIHPDDLDVIGTDMQNISEKYAPPAREIRIRTKGGEYLDVEVRGFLVPSEENTIIGAIIRDISQRKALERQRIQFTNTVLKIQLETTLDGILVVDADNKILLQNEVFLKMWEIKPDVAALQDDKQQIQTVLEHLKDPQAFLARAHHLSEHPEEKSLELLDLKDGRIFERYSAPLHTDNNDYLGRIWYFRDITKAKLQEQEMLRMKKLESVGILAGGIAHDFNNLLAAILGNIDLSTIYIAKENKATLLLKEASKACLRAQSLTQQLLTFSKGGTPVKQTAQVDGIIQDCCHFSLRGSNVDCCFAMADDLWPANCDEGQISQVIQNLIINARHAMPEGGFIDISSKNITHPGNSKLQAGDYLSITIRDHGHGISKPDIANIFDPYFTTKAMGSNKGTGLGLAIVHSIISKHGGSIEVQSEKGHGATFTILLPASTDKEIANQTLSSAPPTSGKGKILVMDDEQMILDLCQRILKFIGYEVTTVQNGAQAIDCYQQAMADGLPFHAAILDVTIPGGMGGEETAKAILELDPKATLIVASGYTTSALIAQPRQYGFCDVLIKPFQMKDIGDVLEKNINC